MTQLKSYSTGDIAKFCGVTLRTVIRWIERGSLKAYKLPGRGNNRVTEQELLKFLHKYEMPVPPELQPNNSVTESVSVVDTHSNRILICDDEKPYADAIRRVLRRAGYETRAAFSGFEAGTELLLFKPALITLDLSMPGMSGFEVVSFIREREALNDIKILVISALSDKDLRKAISLGADAALSKPFENQQLLDHLDQLLA